MDLDKAEQLLKEMHDLSRTYIKIDFLYIGAFAAVLAYFKVDDYAIVKNYTYIRLTGIIIALVLFLDFIFVWLSLKDRFEVLDERFNVEDRINMSKTKQILQLTVHLSALLFVMCTFLGYFDGSRNWYEEMENAAVIQDKVEEYVINNKRSPVSLREINDEDYQMFLSKTFSRVVYAKTSVKGYEIKIFRQGDDKNPLVVADYFNIRDYIKNKYEKKVE
ncbi:TPA: hypothetical protein QHY27_001817 [Enterobacter kobei]|uniref:hypothetical protein n=1 Tax=Enterobacter kobei TaxID=208224 RepID=UPI0002779E58|nr:hypothetical protein [Enterobacter kobei]AFP70220.1 hypothetical protein ECENHK_11795 [Enterobacter kobei]HDS5029896.1 hypothetical protein [Enterobacter kobei]